jgi:hypothetical protein
MENIKYHSVGIVTKSRKNIKYHTVGIVTKSNGKHKIPHCRNSYKI